MIPLETSFTKQLGQINETCNLLIDLPKTCIYLSFNEAPCAKIGLFVSDNNSAETAFCHKEYGKQDIWIILNGDFRAQIEKMIEGGAEIDDIIKWFKFMHKEHGSTWSTWAEEREEQASIINWARARGLIED